MSQRNAAEIEAFLRRVPYAQFLGLSLIGDGNVAEQDRDPVMRALLDCPVHAITEVGERQTGVPNPALREDDDPASRLKTEANEAEWGFTR